ncbi:MAG: LacI family DNA-binding transcriptional regulator [Oscillospiraceae bacterium]|nr:LacI family DNA-binding transcriptional regulator [Oscillospiraceae bacterium]
MNISEIARRAGVSNAAVSRYLNNGYLSEEKRAAIRRVIEETGYRPSVQAQTLRTRKTKTVGVILPRIDSSSTGSVMSGIAATLERKEFRLLLADTHNDPAKELEYLEIFGQQNVDGVILIATVFTPAHIRAIRERKIPIVIVGQHLPNTPCVYHDDYHAFYDMTKLVLEKGCRRLGYIGALAQDRAVGQERSCAFQDAVREAGLPEQPAVIADFSILSGRQKARELLESTGPLDALVCATDSIAAGALQYLRSQGLRVPEQILLTGHGASDVSGVTNPTITTIRYYYEESGAEAAGLLLELMDKPSLPPKEIKLGYTIVENESTAR